MRNFKILILLVFLVSSCWINNNNVKFVYTTTDFSNIENKSGFNDHFNTKQSKWSNVYIVNFKDRESFERELVTSSDKRIVYHDFCKVWDVVYAVWGEFWVHKGSSRLVQVYPAVDNKKLYSDDEIRFRDCELIEQDWKKYLAIVSHWKAEILLYDIENKKLLDKKIVSYDWEIDWKKYQNITMIHEVISADLDWDWKKEFYFTPTSKNGSTNIDQRWKIYKSIINNWKLSTEEFYDLWEAYAKEVHKITLENWKDILLVSVQWKTKINAEKEKNTKQKLILKFKSWKKIVKKNMWKISDIIRPVELIALYLDKGKVNKKSLTKVRTSVQCRTIEEWNFYNEKWKVDFILWCNRWAIRFFTLDNDLQITLKKMLRVPEKQIHSFYAVDTDWDGKDEAFVWIDFDWLYHIDLDEKEKMFKMYDYSKSETWVWAIEGVK
jgi:hypothetical protein